MFSFDLKKSLQFPVFILKTHDIFYLVTRWKMSEKPREKSEQILTVWKKGISRFIYIWINRVHGTKLSSVVNCYSLAIAHREHGNAVEKPN